MAWRRGAHGRACPAFGADPSLAHTGQVESGTFLHLDADRDWSGADPEISLERTLLHELGHVLGLDHTPDPEALLHADPRVDRVTRSDRDALHTLYGGPAPDGDDLVVTQGGRRVAALFGVAPAAAWELFDTDGDGDDEVCVWRTDAAGAGELLVFHFGPGAQPVRTVGPRPGMVDADAAVVLTVDDAGQRLLVLAWPNGHRIARRFDDEGRLHAHAADALPALELPPRRRLEGDVDGDGVRERLGRPST